MNNPEFRRNLWLELSPQRLVLMPSVLAVVGALTVYLSPSDRVAQTLLTVFAVIGALLIGIWGSFAVSNSITSEVAERTWDQQRLSALTPWQMAWGKLLGSSIYAWFGGAICAAVVLASGLLGGSSNPPRVIIRLLAAILGGLALHCWLMASRLHTMDTTAASTSPALVRRLFGVFVLLQLLPGAAFMLIRQQGAWSDAPANTWWGVPLGFSSLFLLMAVLALALGLLALWRTMSTQLMVRTIPWAWALGCTALGLIVAGFADGPETAFLWPALVASIALLATYFALFTEKNHAMVWRAVVYYLRQRAWKRLLQSLPLWPVSWLLMLVFTLLYSLSLGLSVPTAADATFSLHASLRQVLWMTLLHALRDAGIYLFFAWRNTTRKPAGMALLTYAVLGYILPMFFRLGTGQMALIFEPLYGVETNWMKGQTLFSPLAWIAMTGHLLVVAGLLAWRWQQVVHLPQPEQAR